MKDRNQIIEDFLPVIEAQIDIMVAVYYNLEDERDDLVSESVVKAFRLIDQYFEKNKDFNGQFANALRNVCRQVTWDFLRKEVLGRQETRTIYDCHTDNFTFPEDEPTVLDDILASCKDDLDVAIVERRVAGEIQQTIADDLGISRTQLINRLKAIGERYKWRQIERGHDGITIREASRTV